ncbi:hypothetical protein ETU08_02045 [Apibacter muscae]|uniref:ankyrin repeat domain-containing protein n=1 Tax=Apibacter muscae TaxID=2509004 RepID=UPI0011ACA91B|nr:ankyrin repeat domain-containing protein [Apibacter muscae]TWP31285.1 hypothetical protein ETU08_02045 [Apibacter muscae]
MKRKNYLLVLFCLMSSLFLLSCLDPIKSKNRKKYTPEFCFEEPLLPLAEAIYQGNAREIEKLVHDNQIDLNTWSSKSGFTPLYYACLLEDVSVVKKLLDLGADPNLVSFDIIKDKKYPRTELCLTFVVARGNMSLTRLLLEKGANPNNPIDILPLNYAMAHKNSQEYIDLLMKYGADANFLEAGSIDNAAQIAFTGRHFELINYFLDQGADPRSVNRLGYSLALLVQEELEEPGRTKEARETLENIKKRLEKEYGIRFPVQLQRRQGMINEINQYEKIPEYIRKLPLMESSNKYIIRVKDSLAAGKTISGRPLES